MDSRLACGGVTPSFRYSSDDVMNERAANQEFHR
jgi:hypothetical protein